MSSQSFWPDWMLAPAAWPACQKLVSRCLELAASKRLPATLMLVGQPGLGREAVAVELAAGLAVHGGPPAGCGCASCGRVRRGIHPDVAIVGPGQGKKGADGEGDSPHPALPERSSPPRRGSDITIEQARDLAGTIDLCPYEGERRVFIFSSCQTPPLNNDAASALLKTLEEPPAHVTFLLLAANPECVLPTILSRSVQVRVPPPSRAEAAALIARACKIDLDRAAGVLAACYDDPALVLPTDASPLAASDGEAALGQPEDVEELVGAARRLDALLPAVLARDPAALLATAALIQGNPAALPLAVASLLRTAESATPEQSERALDAAAALLAEERRRALLRLKHESAVLTALTPFAAGAR